MKRRPRIVRTRREPHRSISAAENGRTTGIFRRTWRFRCSVPFEKHKATRWPPRDAWFVASKSRPPRRQCSLRSSNLSKTPATGCRTNGGRAVLGADPLCPSRTGGLSHARERCTKIGNRSTCSYQNLVAVEFLFLVAGSHVTLVEQQPHEFTDAKRRTKSRCADITGSARTQAR